MRRYSKLLMSLVVLLSCFAAFTSPSMAASKMPTYVEATVLTPNPVSGQFITVKITVINQFRGGTTPTGEIGCDPGLLINPIGMLDATGSWLCQTNLLTKPNTFAIEYLGDAGHEPSSIGLFVDPAPAPTTTALSYSPKLPAVGSTITFTTTVNVVAPGTGGPDGTVSIVADGVTIASGTVFFVQGPTATSSTIILTSNKLSKGVHQVQAVYTNGSGYFLGSQSAITGVPVGIKLVVK